MPRSKQRYISGEFRHRRAECDYMRALLDAVTLKDWREIVASPVAAAKEGDTSARLFLAQYLVGRPDLKAPAPMTVVVQQLSGRDRLVEQLALPHIERLEYPALHSDDEVEDAVKECVAAELRALQAQK